MATNNNSDELNPSSGPLEAPNAFLDSSIEAVPSQRISLPKSNDSTQIQQVKAAGISPKLNTAVPVSPSNVSPTTQGQPKNLSNIQIVKTSISNSQYQLTVSFDRDPSDPYYTHTVVHLIQGTNQ